MNYEDANAQMESLVATAKTERLNGNSRHMIELITAQIEIHKEGAIRAPDKAHEFRGSVTALRQLLSLTEHLTEE